MVACASALTECGKTLLIARCEPQRLKAAVDLTLAAWLKPGPFKKRRSKVFFCTLLKYKAGESHSQKPAQSTGVTSDVKRD